MNHEKFMAQAIQLALDNVQKNNGGPFGAVVVKDDTVIATGVNQVTTTNDPTAHAEIVAIRNACKALNSFQLNDCILHTSCQPCPMCFGALYWARTQAVYFGCSAADAAQINFDDAFIYEQLAKPHDQQQIPMKQLMREEALKPFRAWQHSTAKISY